MTPEGKVKQAVKRKIDQYETIWGDSVWQWWPVPSGYGASKLDCLVHHNGHSCWVETKTEGKELTPRQLADKRDIEAAGILVFVIDSKECAALETFYQWLIATKKYDLQELK